MATSATSATTSSGIDVNSIVSQLMTVERQPITKLDAKVASYQAKLSAYGSIKGAMANFQTAVQGLNSSSKLQAVKATPSDTTIFSASAASSAVAGAYSLEVASLAQAQKLVSVGQTSSTAAIGTGTITFDFGTISGTLLPTGKYDVGASFVSNGGGTKSITIDGSNNSLQGIRDAINAAKIGVTAAIVNDGSGTPYRLTLSSDSAGASNSLKISVSGDAALGTLLANDPAGTQNLSETVTAQNANFKVNGVPVSKTSNIVSDVVQGVTLTLNKVTTSPATLTVARDTAAISGSISGFVKAYNDFAKVLKDSSAYDAASKTGAALLGDATVRTLQSQLRGMLNTPVVGTAGMLTMLSDIGVSFQKDGTLALNQAKLDSAIANNFSEIASLFAATGKATDSLVTYGSATSSTKAGNYAVNITQIAMRGSATGNALGGGIVVPANNTIASGTTIGVTLDGVSASVALAAGNYTAAQLAAMIQSAINGTPGFSLAGSSVAATIDGGGYLSIVSNKYGSASHVSVADGAGTPLSTIVGTLTSAYGVDVAGTIGGAAASGSGQTLSATSGDPQGLSIVVNGSATGARGMLNYSNGYAYLLDKWATSSLASDGILASRTDGIGKTITDIGKQRTALENRLANVEKRYRAQFTALDAMLSSMNQTSTYLTQQLSQLSKM